jgi:hypothetical protein
MWEFWSEGMVGFRDCETSRIIESENVRSFDEEDSRRAGKGVRGEFDELYEWLKGAIRMK